MNALLLNGESSPHYNYKPVAIPELDDDQDDDCLDEFDEETPMNGLAASRPSSQCSSILRWVCFLALQLTFFVLAVVATSFWLSFHQLPTPSTVWMSLYPESPKPVPVEQTFVHVNHQRWARVLNKLLRGQAITMGFNGGSITHQPWAYHSQLGELLMQAFPVNERMYMNDSKVYRNSTTGKPMHHMINHAAPAMTSDAASLCVSQSFKDEEIDVVSLEYAVNDFIAVWFSADEHDPIAAFSPADNIERFARGYLTRPNGPAVMMPLFSFMDGRGSEPQHQKLPSLWNSDAFVARRIHQGLAHVDWRLSSQVSAATSLHEGGHFAPQQRRAPCHGAVAALVDQTRVQQLCQVRIPRPRVFADALTCNSRTPDSARRARFSVAGAD